MTPFIRFTLRALLIADIATAQAAPGPDAATAADQALIEAVEADNLAAARAALDIGASPNAWAGKEAAEMAVCNATRPGRAEMLELLIARGADVDRIYVEALLDYRAPLACAINFGNGAAFDRLLEEGASSNRLLCPNCINALSKNSMLTTAAIAREYGMMLRLLELTPPSEDGLYNVVYTIERRRPPTDPDALRDRRSVIAWLHEHGHAVVPRESRAG